MKNKLTIAIDYDDVLALCTEYAVQLETAKGNALDYASIDKWGKTGRNTDVIFRYFADEEFYKTQPLYEGAKDFISALINMGHEIVILTAVDPIFASIRAEKILREFPDVKKENIILSSRKDLVNVDVLIDDAPHNIDNTPAKFPILFRRPWNQNLTGLISVYNYEEILNFIIRVSNLDKAKNTGCKVYCLVGPSGSGKTAITQQLLKDPRYEVVRSTTTRARREGEPANAYNFVSREEFEALYEQGHFIETTVYAGNRYGTTKDEIDAILKSNRNAVIPMDWCGANALKMYYGDQCVTVFVKRRKEFLIKALLDRLEKQLLADPRNAEKIKEDIQNRILSLNSEKKNEELCDKVLVNNGELKDVVAQL